MKFSPPGHSYNIFLILFMGSFTGMTDPRLNLMLLTKLCMFSFVQLTNKIDKQVGVLNLVVGTYKSNYY